MRKIIVVVANFITSFVLVFGGVTAPALSTGCKPTYIDPVTHEEIPCDQLPKVDLDYVVNLIAKFASTITPQGGFDWAKIYQLAAAETVQRGGCALASFVNHFLAPPPGIAAPAPEEAAKARETLEQLRAKHGGKVTWRNADGERQ